jgi:hypothetical protein
MLHLMRTIDRVLGYVFVQAPSQSDDEKKQVKGTLQPNQDALFSSAMGALPGHRIQDIQERCVALRSLMQTLNYIGRWIDNREEYDAWESREWRQEGMEAAKQEGRT